jgi:hypothetical protein
MSIHQDQPSQGKQVIDQYIKAIDLCLREKIDAVNCLGYPAASLIFNVIDALSSYNKPQTTQGSCFDILKNDPFNLTEKHIVQLQKWYRHKLTHAGSMTSGVTLSIETENIFSFNENDEIVDINIQKLFDFLKSEWCVKRIAFDPTIQVRNKRFSDPVSSSPLLSTSGTHPTSGSPPVSGVA